MIIVRAARQLPLSSLLARHSSPASSTIAIRSYNSQGAARAPPLPASPSSSPPSSTPADLGDTPREAAPRSPLASDDGGSTGKPDNELGDLIRRMMHSRRRPKTRFDSADEVAAELDRMSGDPMAQRQGQLLDKRLSENQSLDHDILALGRRASKLPPLPPPVRCDAYIGRQETIGKGVTLARALDKLNIKLALNRVRADVRKQRFHERPGLRRKRLKRERWRRRFKGGFVATVQKVQKMRKQGW